MLFLKSSQSFSYWCLTIFLGHDQSLSNYIRLEPEKMNTFSFIKGAKQHLLQKQFVAKDAFKTPTCYLQLWLYLLRLLAVAIATFCCLPFYAESLYTCLLMSGNYTKILTFRLVSSSEIPRLISAVPSHFWAGGQCGYIFSYYWGAEMTPLRAL